MLLKSFIAMLVSIDGVFCNIVYKYGDESSEKQSDTENKMIRWGDLETEMAKI